MGGNMKEGLIIGMALGLIAGAILVKNNQEVEKMVNKGEKAVKNTMKHLKNQVSKK